MVIFAAAEPGAAGPAAGDSDPAGPVDWSGAVDSVDDTKTSSFLVLYNVIEILLVVPRIESSALPLIVSGQAACGLRRPHAAHLRQHQQDANGTENK
jgi:hypothetical protein